MRNQLLAQLGDPKTSSGFLYKVISSKRLSCLYMLRPLQRSQGNQGIFRPLLCRTKIVANIFLPYMINDWWNKPDSEIRRIYSYIGFRKDLLSFIKPTANKAFSIYDSLRIKLLNRFTVDFSHIFARLGQKFRPNFADTLNPLCPCSLETENRAHFFLRW